MSSKEYDTKDNAAIDVSVPDADAGTAFKSAPNGNIIGKASAKRRRRIIC
jgi:hypothetical protein